RGGPSRQPAGIGRRNHRCRPPGGLRHHARSPHRRRVRGSPEMTMTRRSFVTTAALGAAAATLEPWTAEAAASDFSFVHFTDVHIQPELHASEGSRMCMDAINATK